ncbi:MAG TPA: hypothetical protein VFW38_09620 [Solirubrobacteraceae bacterium]|nr:hypothetical protein [Solirubrobacteraceae bacterium]
MQASVVANPPGRARADRLLLRPWAIGLLAALPLAVLYLILAPPAGDLAAATYRSELFARVGFTSWDTGWYAAHGYWLPSYSLLSPALGAWLGVRLLLALSAVVACSAFAAIAARQLLPTAAKAAAVVFALGFCVGMLSGRVPFDLGFAIALGAVLALLSGKLTAALILAALASAASPVAGTFLCLAGVAGALAAVVKGERVGTRASGLLAFAALAPTAILSLVYPNGGYEPFAASAFWPALAGVLAIALLLPRGQLSEQAHLTLRIGAWLYTLMLIAAYALRTPMGGNAARLGPLLAAPLLAGVLWQHNRTALAVLALPLLYWQLATPIKDVSSLAGDRSVDASYYAPLRAELQRLTGDRTTIVEVPLTKAHWEAAYLAGHDGIELARGWERQLDTRYGAIFYERTLSAAAYRAWLTENRVRYVALPDVPLDGAGRQEGALVGRGVPYLREIWHKSHWRLYRFMG